MKISLDTETEELFELRAAIAIIEDAIKRRTNPDEEEPKDYKEATQDFIQKEESYKQKHEEPSVDISALSMSDYGRKIENRNLDNLQEDNKTIVKEIILDLSEQNPDQPIQMSDIISRCSRKNIQDEEVRRLIEELKESEEI